MTRAILFAAILLGAVGAASAADAHAFLNQSSPPVGSTVPAPKQVQITFTEGVEPAFSTIVVKNAQGERVDAGDAHLVSGNDRLLAVGVKPLPPGKYSVVWHVTAVDTHKTEGSFAFTVSP